LLFAAPPCSASEQTLDNGLRVVLIPHRANPMVASSVVVGAGVVDEEAAASGASHFLEHLLFNGTTTRTQRQLYDDADRIGAYNNATTREDHTLFTLLVAKEHAEEGLAIQADMLFRSTIPDENFEKERKIVLEELARDRVDPSYDVEAAFRAFAYAGTPIARPVLGTEASLGAITRSQVLAYYKKRYVPANMTLVVMGDFEDAAMLAMVKRTLGGAPRAALPKATTGSWPAPPKENVELATGEQEPARLLAAFPLEGSPWDATTAAAMILLAATGDGADAPLMRALRSRGVKPIAPTLGIDTRRAPWSTVAFDVKLEQGPDPKSVLDALGEAILATRAGGDARARIDRVLAKSRAEAAIARDQIHYFAMTRSSSILGSPRGSVDGDAAILAALGPADWDAASARLIAGLPALRARLVGSGVAARRLSWVPPQDARGPADSRTEARSGTLANGLRYVVRGSVDSDVFAMHLAFAPRAAGEPSGLSGITDLLHRMIARATTFHDQASLEDRLARLGARVKTVDDPSVPFDDYYTTPEFSWLRLEVPAGQWREAVGLLAEMVRFPALSAEALDEARRDMLERVARREGSPRDVAMGALDTLLAPGNAMTQPVYGTRDSLQAMTLDALRAYHASHVVGRGAIATVVSPVDSADVVKALESDLGLLSAGDDPPPVVAAALAPKASSITATLGKSQAYLAMGSVLDVPPEDRAPLTIAVAMLSDRLAFDLRETKGLAYSIGASIRPWAGRTRLDIGMGTRAENLDEARAGIEGGMRAFQAASLSPADVERAINVARGAALMRRMTRISLAYEAGIELLRGRPTGDERRFVDSLKDVQAADVKRVAAEYLNPEPLSAAIVR
jgi:predicted Zn-dependent peptidase